MKKHATLLAVSQGWEDAYIKDEATKMVYYGAAPNFKKVSIDETILRSSMAVELLVPEKQDFPSVNVALVYVKKKYETQDEHGEIPCSGTDPLIPFSEAVDVIFDYAREINHPLANPAPKRKKHRQPTLEMPPPTDEADNYN